MKTMVPRQLSATMVAHCDFDTSPDDFPPPPQTDILEVQMVPDPARMNEEVTFMCIIRDSLNTSFQFRWFLPGPDTTTQGNTLRWIANVEPGQHTLSVTADNGDPDSAPPTRAFIIEVKQ